ncbi:hypothetical protein M0D21_16745 [Aquimarina sp. D1M17]|uniref:DPP IV N-terminal domain-containing protein n=1 Tax=Aquimarina acroporae TaxID=2937283 RepID=UPI0020BF7CA8|nr:DPP IV N-terminal domain-containing protein [Aquimarina acroporae]MCK8523230.1 hypothetical protein [Aquimarina acroporae]
MKNLILVLLLFLSLFSGKKNDGNFIDCEEMVLKTKAYQDTSTILFSRKKDNDSGWSIYKISPNGIDEEVIIPFKYGQGEYNPAIAPDGNTIMFNSYRYGGWKLAVYDTNTKEVSKISKKLNYYVNGVFSSDGKKIAYERNVERSTHIFVANSDGTKEVNLTSEISNDNRAPSWNSNDTSILFYYKKNRTNDIFAIDVRAKITTNLTNNNSGNDFNPSISPNGKQVAFFSDRNGYLDVYVMDINGENQICLTRSLHNENNEYNYYTDSNVYWIFKVSWSPDGQYLVFSNIQGDNIDLFTIKKDGTDLKQITKTPKSEYTPVWGILKN